MKLLATLDLPTLGSVSASNGADAVREIYRIDRLVEFATLLEEANFDAVFQTDAVFFDK